MNVHSAGILVYRFNDNKLQVILVHPGGPFWAKKDAGAWSIPKGIYEQDEEPLEAAIREFKEETGFVVYGPFVELGALKQPSKKIIIAWAVESNFDLSKLNSNTFTLEWPRNSGNVKEYPEVDRAEWFVIEAANNKILKGQREFLDRLIEKIGYVAPKENVENTRVHNPYQKQLSLFGEV